MKVWTKILPFLFIEWYAKKQLERFNLNTKTPVFTKNKESWVSPFKGILILIDDEGKL